MDQAGRTRPEGSSFNGGECGGFPRGKLELEQCGKRKCRQQSGMGRSRQSDAGSGERVSDGDARLRGLLKGAQLRVTKVRVDVLRVLEGSEHALNAQQVFDAAEGVRGSSKRGGLDRVTVYRTLNTLVESGLAHRVDPGDRVFRFRRTDHSNCTHGEHEIPPDYEHQPHPHFVCDSCGTVECLEAARVEVRSVEPRARARMRGSERKGTAGGSPPGRRVVNQDVVLHGTCAGCTTTPPRAHAASRE